MENLRLTNYRCFEDTGILTLTRLNFLIGANNSGKSSIVKIFPLIKQSNGILRNGMFLWNGNEIDFQNLSNIQRDHRTPLILEFTIDTSKIMVDGALKTKAKEIKVEIHLSSFRTYFDKLRYLKIIYEDQCVEIRVDISGKVEVSVNNRLHSYSDQSLKK